METKTTKIRTIPFNRLCIKQTAKIIGIAQCTLQQKLAPSGVKRYGKFKIPARKHNGIWTFKRSDIIDYMRQEFSVEVDIDDILSKLAVRGGDNPLS